MLNYISNTLMLIIQHELIKYEPEIQAAIIEQFEILIKYVFDYLKNDLNNPEDPPNDEDIQ